jgi:hypothetical protein
MAFNWRLYVSPNRLDAIEEVFGDPKGIEFGAVSDRIMDIYDGLEAAVVAAGSPAGFAEPMRRLRRLFLAAESVVILKFKRRRELPKHCDALPKRGGYDPGWH